MDTLDGPATFTLRRWLGWHVPDTSGLVCPGRAGQGGEVPARLRFDAAPSSSRAIGPSRRALPSWVRLRTLVRARCFCSSAGPCWAPRCSFCLSHDSGIGGSRARRCPWPIAILASSGSHRLLVAFSSWWRSFAGPPPEHSLEWPPLRSAIDGSASLRHRDLCAHFGQWHR